jgi:ABC-type uncharacterized transport system auxiliary subunit
MLTAPTPTAEVEFSAKLVDSDGTVAGARIFSANGPVKAADDPVAVTGALDAAFGKAATDLIVWTLATLSATPDERKEPAEAPAPAEPDAAPTDTPPG